MKKSLPLFLLMLTLSQTTLFAQLGVGQQLRNNAFEEWENPGGDKDIVEPKHWNSLMTGSGSLAFAAEKVITWGDFPGHGHCVKLEAKSAAFKIVANGMFTTGRANMGHANAKNSKNCTYTIPVYKGNDFEADAFRADITAFPDSIYYWAKSVNASSSSKSRMYAVLHDNFMYQDPNPTSAKESVNNATAEQNESHVVALKEDWFNTNGQWQLQKSAFKYTQNENPRFLLISFSTNYIPSGGSAGDLLYVDEVVLIYNTRLATLSIDGKPLKDFDPDRLEYTYPDPSGAKATNVQFPTITATTASPHATATVQQATLDNPVATITVTHRNQENDNNLTKVYRIHFDVTSLGITDNGKEEEITLYPNPAKNQFTLTAQSALIEHIDIYDMAGKQVDHKAGNHLSTITIDCSLPSGIYFAKVQTNQGMITKQLIIQ